MPETIDDAELLRHYAGARSESAFSELVRRHLSWVYGFAARQLGGDLALAEAVSQRVFSALARNAAARPTDAFLVSWLYGQARAACDAERRAERGRGRRETAVSSAGGQEEAADWPKVGAALAEALEEISDLDRESLLRRVWAEQPWEEIAAQLSLSEPAVRMRVERGLGRFQASLAVRSIPISGPAVEALLARAASVGTPPALHPKITNAALDALAEERSRPVDATRRRGPGTLAAAALALALVAIAVAAHQFREAQRADGELAAMRAQVDALSGENRSLRERLQAESRRTQAADEDNARLLEAMTSVAAAQPAPPAVVETSITPELVRTRFKRAGELARSGRFAEALQDYLWCYDEGMPKFNAFAGIRGTVLARAIAELGRQYPGALQALRTRRDALEQRLQTNVADHDAPAELADLNEALGESARTLAQFDKLAADDPRRTVLAAELRNELAELGRYREAARARPYWQMSADFEAASTAFGRGSGNVPPAAREDLHANLIRSTSADVEVLAGDGDLTHARQLARRLLAFDDSDETRRQLEQRLTRAGQPDLLASSAKR